MLDILDWLLGLWLGLGKVVHGVVSVYLCKGVLDGSVSVLVSRCLVYVERWHVWVDIVVIWCTW